MSSNFCKVKLVRFKSTISFEKQNNRGITIFSLGLPWKVEKGKRKSLQYSRPETENWGGVLRSERTIWGINLRGVTERSK